MFLFSFHNVYSFDLITDEKTLILKNSRFPMFVFDNEMNVRLASQELLDGTVAYFRPKTQYPRSTEPTEWVEYLRVDVEDKPITM